MRTKGMLIAVFSLVFAFAVTAVSRNAYSVEPSQVVADHLAMAKSYEEKAAAMDKVIAEHEKMKKDYKYRFYINEKVTPLGGRLNTQMIDHCDTIIKDSEKLKAHYLEFARWHREVAKELQGK